MKSYVCESIGHSSHGFTRFDFPVLTSESFPGMSKGDFVLLLFISKHSLHWTNSKIGIIIDEKVILELPDTHTYNLWCFTLIFISRNVNGGKFKWSAWHLQQACTCFRFKLF